MDDGSVTDVLVEDSVSSLSLRFIPEVYTAPHYTSLMHFSGGKDDRGPLPHYRRIEGEYGSC